MGCDIHAYIETKAVFDDRDFWDCPMEVHLHRNYTLFSAMAGVKGDLEPVVPPRGWPKNTSDTVRYKSALFITDNPGSSEGCCSVEEAQHYGSEVMGTDDSGAPRLIRHPDWHTPSWLTAEELELVQRRLEDAGGLRVVELDAVIAAMEAFLREYDEVRLVFWFDS